MPNDMPAVSPDIATVWAEHGRWLVRFAEVQIGGDRYAAEDVVQETMLRLWRHPTALQEVASLRSWLATVVRNIVIDRSRRRSARPDEVPDAAAPETAVPDDTAAVLGELVVLEVLSTISPAHRAAVLEVYVRDRSMQQAARTLGVPVGTVKSRCHYALRLLREQSAAVPAEAA